jgi:hypothetical protein
MLARDLCQSPGFDAHFVHRVGKAQKDGVLHQPGYQLRRACARKSRRRSICHTDIASRSFSFPEAPVYLGTAVLIELMRLDIILSTCES